MSRLFIQQRRIRRNRASDAGFNDLRGERCKISVEQGFTQSAQTHGTVEVGMGQSGLAKLDRPLQGETEDFLGHEPLVWRGISRAEVALRIAAIGWFDIDRKHARHAPLPVRSAWNTLAVSSGRGATHFAVAAAQMTLVPRNHSTLLPMGESNRRDSEKPTGQETAVVRSEEAERGSTQLALLTERQHHFFETFGFLHLPGFFAAEIDSITQGFEAAFALSLIHI